MFYNIKCCITSNVVSHQMLCHIKCCITSNVVSHQMLYCIKCCITSNVVSHLMYSNLTQLSQYQEYQLYIYYSVFAGELHRMRPLQSITAVPNTNTCRRRIRLSINLCYRHDNTLTMTSCSSVTSHHQLYEIYIRLFGAVLAESGSRTVSEGAQVCEILLWRKSIITFAATNGTFPNEAQVEQLRCTVFAMSDDGSNFNYEEKKKRLKR